MSKYVKVVVVDDDGDGVCGIKVKTYGGDSVRTDRDGVANLFIEGSSTTLYVNDFTAYDGSVSRMDSTMVFDKCGRRQ